MPGLISISSAFGMFIEDIAIASMAACCAVNDGNSDIAGCDDGGGVGATLDVLVGAIVDDVDDDGDEFCRIDVDVTVAFELDVGKCVSGVCADCFGLRLSVDNELRLCRRIFSTCTVPPTVKSIDLAFHSFVSPRPMGRDFFIGGGAFVSHGDGGVLDVGGVAAAAAVISE